MTNETATLIVTGVVAVSRILSHFEHKKTEKTASEIKIYINGEMEKKIAEAKEQGREEERNKTKK